MFLKQLTINISIFLTSVLGLIFNRRNLLITLITIELILLSLNLTFIIISIYGDDFYGQIFSLFILTIAAAESAIGLAIIIIYYNVRGKISIAQEPLLKN